MAEKQRMQAPSGMAGLVRYYEEEKSLVKLRPEHVVAFCAALVILEIFLYLMFPL
ncbi:MAG: preprotein translocase subunit Sec61beta [Candidatus Aenigmatarchaeota archaeon]